MARAFDELQPLNGPWPPSLNAPMRSVNTAAVDTNGPTDAGVIADDAGNNPVQGNFRPGRLNPADPAVDTFRQRFAPFSSDPVGDFIEQQRLMPRRTIVPGTRERFGDPTKVIAGDVPTPDTPADFALPRGFTVPQQQAAPEDFPLPKGFTPVDEGQRGNKLQRFLKNVTPEGPISGVIGLMRTAGEAAHGQRPDLLTNPENAVPEAVTGMAAGTGARSLRNIEGTAAALSRMGGGQEIAPPAGQLKLTHSNMPVPENLARWAAERDEGLAQARMDAKKLTAEMANRGELPATRGGLPIEMPGPPGSVPPASPLLPPQLVREFGAVRKGVELKDRLNPESPSNLSARDQALASAIQPHLKAINTVASRTPAAQAALEAAIPSMAEATSTPGKAASVANWMQVYERAARAKFSDQAKASLGLATKNLNNNLGLDLNLSDFLKGP